MKGIFVLLFALHASAGLKGRESKNKKNYRTNNNLTGGRIIGGEDGDHVKLPFIVSIQRLQEGGLWRQYCGGSIVSATAVLTACHCINQHVKMTPFVLLDPNVLRIVAGVGNVSQQSANKQEVVAKQLIPHPKCQNSADYPFFCDSAVVLLQKALVFNSEVQPLKVFSNNPSSAATELRSLLSKGETCLIAGWGRTALDKDYGPLLQVAEVTLMTPQNCQTTFCQLNANRLCRRDFMKLNQFCAIGSKSSSICFADSGGPIVCNGFVFGTISYSTPNCSVHWPGVYADVEVILQMINAWGEKTNKQYFSGTRQLKEKKSSISRHRLIYE